jgi:hypothetical protein
LGCSRDSKVTGSIGHHPVALATPDWIAIEAACWGGIMFATFMPRMIELSESYSSSDSGGQAQAPGGFDPTNVDFGEMRLLFFAAAAIQAIGDGVVGGLMSSGRIWNGLQMSSVFALATWLIFDLVLL